MTYTWYSPGRCIKETINRRNVINRLTNDSKSKSYWHRSLFFWPNINWSWLKGWQLIRKSVTDASSTPNLKTIVGFQHLLYFFDVCPKQETCLSLHHRINTVWQGKKESGLLFLVMCVLWETLWAMITTLSLRTLSKFCWWNLSHDHWKFKQRIPQSETQSLEWIILSLIVIRTFDHSSVTSENYSCFASESFSQKVSCSVQCTLCKKEVRFQGKGKYVMLNQDP